MPVGTDMLTKQARALVAMAELLEHAGKPGLASILRKNVQDVSMSMDNKATGKTLRLIRMALSFVNLKSKE